MMTSKKTLSGFWWIACIVLAVTPIEAQSPVAEAPTTVTAMFLSDIHLNPFHDPALVARFAGKATPKRSSALETQTPAEPSALASARQACLNLPDTPDDLFRSSLASIQLHAGSVSFVTVSGDLISHQFIRCFAAFVLKEEPKQSESAQYLALSAEQRLRYRSFVQKAIEYITGQLHETFGNTPIYYALGNNDSDCGDYFLDPHGAFLHDMAEIVVKALPSNLSRPELATIRADFAAGGYYSAPLAAAPNTRILVLDDVFLSGGNATCAGKADPEPATSELAWLRKQLETLNPGENAWIMGHIPPGLDAYSSLKSHKPVLFLKYDFMDVLQSQNGVVPVAIFAHTHLDGLSEIPSKDADHPVTLKMVQSISPDHGNPPTYTLAKIDPKTGALLEYTLISATKSGANGGGAKYMWPDAGAPVPPPTWSSSSTKAN
jgi:sphingomyelin phosphodiesterase acid-like 3